MKLDMFHDVSEDSHAPKLQVIDSLESARRADDEYSTRFSYLFQLISLYITPLERPIFRIDTSK